MRHSRTTTAQRRAGKATLAGLALVAALAASAYALGATRAEPQRNRPRAGDGLALSAVLSRRTIAPGAAARYPLHIRRDRRLVLPLGHGHPRIAARIFLSIAGPLPRGVSATLTPRSTRSGDATVTLRAAAGAAAGRYHVRVNARGRLRHDARHPVRHARTVLTLVIAQPLRVRVQPSARSIAPGATAGYEVRVSRRGRLIRQRDDGRQRLAARVWLHVARPLARGITATLSPRSTRTSRARLTLGTAASLPPGTYRVRLDAHGRLNRDPVRRVHTTVMLVVASPVRVTFPISGRTTSMLSPGVSAPLDLSLTNDHGSALTVGQLVVRVDAVHAPEADAAHPCTLADFAVAQFSGAYGFLVPSSSTSKLSALGISAARWPRIAMINRSHNQDGCKGATLTLAYTGFGWGTAS